MAAPKHLKKLANANSEVAEIEPEVELPVLDDDYEPYYYYDNFENFEKLRLHDMPGSYHDSLIKYLIEVIEWLFRNQTVAIYREMNFYRTNNPNEVPLYPDIALMKGQEWRGLDSYRLGVDGRAPHLIIEVISTKSKRSDTTTKPKKYEAWATEEYFAYDNRPRLRRRSAQRLLGWRLNRQGKYEVIKAENDGRMWSEQLQCWLVPDDLKLRLYSADNKMLLSKSEWLERAFRQIGIDPDSINLN
jgi:Uma2 family endonuclease